ncbi:NAD(P)-dependent oxidoreductase [Chromohalobacter sarecensis]|uniref:NAD(P)-dependent oxidoreductase n=1 Tax=Chromohalobacter sarecensis TaxID=245294 RepID=A0ABV9CZF6_9GAMM|nr:NAD(P)-dependent oxidoreductase [Chromohalobacter sarecensis]MCK0713610.1 NAD(P)-dependent oxidoreductase [Chromohalobacter sarecensis]
MTLAPILLIGGAGIVGRQTARFLREMYPELPLLIGGRDLGKAQQAAAGIGNAEGVAVDLTAQDLDLGERPVSAIAIFFTDTTTAALQFAQRRGIPYLSVSPAMTEVGPEIAAYVHRPNASAVVLGTEWLVGATTLPALACAKAFRHIDAIRIGALIDEQDEGGPASYDDLERQTQALPAVQARRNGAWVWRSGDDLETRFRAADGTMLQATGLSPHDVFGLATVTGAPNIEFNLAIGVSSSRRRGEPMSTEIIIELEGENQAAQPLRSRHAVTHPEGQMPLTGLGVALLLERLVGLDGKPVTSPGLYFPYQLLDSQRYFERFAQAGGRIVELNVR